jgi:hypothetical protein
VDPRGDYAYKKPKHSSNNSSKGTAKSDTPKDGESTAARPSYAQLREALPRYSEATIESLALVDESIINYEVRACVLSLTNTVVAVPNKHLFFCSSTA